MLHREAMVLVDHPSSKMQQGRELGDWVQVIKAGEGAGPRQCSGDDLNQPRV